MEFKQNKMKERQREQEDGKSTYFPDEQILATADH